MQSFLIHSMAKEIYSFGKDGTKSLVTPKVVDREHQAALVEVDPLELTDKRLSPEESVIKETEELLKIESKKRIHGQDDLEQVERSAGPRMYFTEILRKLLSCNPERRLTNTHHPTLMVFLLTEHSSPITSMSVGC
jgi:hypothetical protein